MGFAVHLLFDDDFSDVIKGVWALLADANGTAYMQTSDHLPHVTLAIYDEIELVPAQAALALLAQQTTALRLTFASLGQFLHPKPVLFLAPIVSVPLLELQGRVHTALAAHSRAPVSYYLPGRWVPHCTLALDFEASQLPAALAAAQRLPLPLTGRIRAIEIVSFRPVQHLFETPLVVAPAIS